ncbi:MAG: hypothetical protein ACI4KD_06595 [Oscillospiraceae bacterium]
MIEFIKNLTMGEVMFYGGIIGGGLCVIAMLVGIPLTSLGKKQVKNKIDKEY